MFFEAKNVVLLLTPVTLLHGHPPLPPPHKPGKLHSDYKTHPLSLPDLGVGESYSPKITVYNFINQYHPNKFNKNK